MMYHEQRHNSPNSFHPEMSDENQIIKNTNAYLSLCNREKDSRKGFKEKAGNP